MSLEAMLWALDADVPDPMSRVILINLANYAGEAGRGAWPSQATLERRAGCSERSVRRKLLELEAGGLIRRGDQRMTAHMAGNRRPVVWDLNLSGEAWGDSVTPLEPTPEPVENPPESGDKPVDTSEPGGTPETARGDTVGRQTVLDPKEPLTPSSSVAAVLADGCAQHKTTALHCRACGTAPRGQGSAPRDRLAADRRAAALARRRVIEACPDCDPVGWIETARGAARCSHRGIQGASSDVVS